MHSVNLTIQYQQQQQVWSSWIKFELNIIGAEDSKRAVYALLGDDRYFGPIFNMCYVQVEVTNNAGNLALWYFKEKQHWNNMVQASLLWLDHGHIHHKDSKALYSRLDMQSNVISIWTNYLLLVKSLGAVTTVLDSASQVEWPLRTQLIWASFWCCDLCHHHMHFNYNPYGLLQLIPIPETLLSRVNILFRTPITAAARNSYICIITIVDLLTKKVEWKATWEKTWPHKHSPNNLLTSRFEIWNFYITISLIEIATLEEICGHSWP
jgi:hypothetical protein